MNKAVAKLAPKLRAHGAQLAFARRVRTGPSVVCRWLSGKHRPSTPYRVRIQRIYPDVKIWLWDEPCR